MLPCVPAHTSTSTVTQTFANIGLRHCDLCLAFREFPEQSIPQKNRFVFRVSAIQHIDRPDIPAVPCTRFISPGIFHPIWEWHPRKVDTFFSGHGISCLCPDAVNPYPLCIYKTKFILCSSSQLPNEFSFPQALHRYCAVTEESLRNPSLFQLLLQRIP